MTCCCWWLTQPARMRWSNLPWLKDKVHGGPVTEEEDSLASGLGPVLSMGRKAVHRLKVKWTKPPQVPCRFHLRFG